MGNVALEALSDPPRLRVADTVGNEQYTLFLEDPVEPEPISTDGFRYPVSDAVRVEISGFELPGHVRLHLWNRSGDLEQILDLGGEHRAPAGSYSLEFCRALKTYMKVSSPMNIEVDSDGARVEFGSSTTVEIGARSPRNRPAATITTTDDPSDVMESLSYLGEGLQTATPMRAYPNLRGYPPDLELGAELDVPDGLYVGAQPASLILPPELPYLFEAAPLIYYLNAHARPGSTPRLSVEGETVYEFEPRSFFEQVKSLLGHVFTLDCVVRAAGPYPIESVEVDRLESVVPWEYEYLYEADPGERLRSYLDVPFEPVAKQHPPWAGTAYVEPVVENLESIPHLVSQLIPIETVSPPRVTGSRARDLALESFTDASVPTRSARGVFEGRESFVDIGSSDSTNDVWVGSDIPLSANDFVVEGFRNRLSRRPTDTQSIHVTIVCNESWMAGEAVTVREYYEDCDDLEFEISVHENLDRGELADILATETDFLHYVGHATADGLKCDDGYLDVTSIPSIGADTFLLNACQSHAQAKEMVKGGAIGGIATLSDVTDDQAALVGRTAARLLNLGYPLQTALVIARSRSVVGGQYLTVGDGSVMLVTPDHVPDMFAIEKTRAGYELQITSHRSHYAGVGSLYVPWLDSEETGYLVGKTIGPFEMSAEELRSYLELDNVPVQYDGEFRWAYDLADELA